MTNSAPKMEIVTLIPEGSVRERSKWTNKETIYGPIILSIVLKTELDPSLHMDSDERWPELPEEVQKILKKRGRELYNILDEYISVYRLRSHRDSFQKLISQNTVREIYPDELLIQRRPSIMVAFYHPAEDDWRKWLEDLWSNSVDFVYFKNSIEGISIPREVIEEQMGLPHEERAKGEPARIQEEDERP